MNKEEIRKALKQDRKEFLKELVEIDNLLTKFCNMREGDSFLIEVSNKVLFLREKVEELVGDKPQPLVSGVSE